jgi:nitrite reductase/ring-hydroxylating ferredoxin subunit
VRKIRVAPVSELTPGQVTVVPYGNSGIAVFNVRGRYFALANSCPHMGAPLSAGVVSGTTRLGPDCNVEWIRDDEILTCPWHRWEIELSTGRTLVEPIQRIPTYPVTVESEEIFVEVRS